MPLVPLVPLVPSVLSGQWPDRQRTSARVDSPVLRCTRGALALAELMATLDDDRVRRGQQFEGLCTWFLANDPLYRTELRRIWRWDDWPGRWGADAGIDLVAEDHQGEIWAIQAKAYDHRYAITKADVDSFLSESNRPQFAYRLLIATHRGNGAPHLRGTGEAGWLPWAEQDSASYVRRGSC